MASLLHKEDNQNISVGDEAVKVVVRVRPLSNKELEAGHKSVITVNDATINLTSDGASHEFTFDAVLDGVISPKTIYDMFARNVVEACLSKYNATIFAYGQTGSGKTFTMMDGATNERAGIIPQALRHIFGHIKKEQRSAPCVNDEHFKNMNGTRFQVKASYLEIYNEQIRDLLVDEKLTTPSKPTLREHPKTGWYVENLSSHVVTSIEDIVGLTSEQQEALEKAADDEAEKRFSDGYIAPAASVVMLFDPGSRKGLIERGNAVRTVAATKMNQYSSRSHSIFIVEVRCAQQITPDESTEEGNRKSIGKTLVWKSKLNLVDLAGSERQAKTGTTGVQLKEAIKINLSLSTLGNVIQKLIDPKSTHIGYRDSVLTCLLQDSLGGNSKTVMIANAGPAGYNFDETLSTLRYANQAKSIKNKPKENNDNNDALLQALQEKMARTEDAMRKREEEIQRKHQEMLKKDEENEALRLSLETANALRQQNLEELEQEKLLNRQAAAEQGTLLRQKTQEKNAIMDEMVKLLADHKAATQVMEGQKDQIQRLKEEVEMYKGEIVKLKTVHAEDMNEIRSEMERNDKENRAVLQKLNNDHSETLKSHALEVEALQSEMKVLRAIKYATDGGTIGPVPYNEATEFEEVAKAERRASEGGFELPNALALVIISAKNLLAADINLFRSNSSDPLVKIRFRHPGEDRKTLHDKKWLAITTTKKQTLHPVWNEQFTLPCEFNEEVEVELKVEDWDLMGGNDFLGRIYIPVSDLSRNGQVTRRTFKLLDKDGIEDIERGEIEVAMRWTHDDLWRDIKQTMSPAHNKTTVGWQDSFVNWTKAQKPMHIGSSIHTMTQQLMSKTTGGAGGGGDDEKSQDSSTTKVQKPMNIRSSINTITQRLRSKTTSGGGLGGGVDEEANHQALEEENEKLKEEVEKSKLEHALEVQALKEELSQKK